MTMAHRTFTIDRYKVLYLLPLLVFVMPMPVLCLLASRRAGHRYGVCGRGRGRVIR